MGKIFKYAIIVFLLSLLIGYFIGKFAPNLFSQAEIEEENVITQNIEGNTIDLGTPEQTTIQTSTSKEKILPNATLTLEKEYTDCKHTVKDTAEMPVEMVNLTEEEVKELYKDWEIKKFSETEVYLYKSIGGLCGEHFLITTNDNEITVYKLDENYEKELYEKTGITVEYLPEKDIEKLEDGIYAYGLSELNSELENFE